MKNKEFSTIELYVTSDTKNKFRNICLEKNLIPHRVGVMLIEKLVNKGVPAWIEKEHSKRGSDGRKRGAIVRKSRKSALN